MVDLAVAAAIQDLPLQIFVFEKCTFTTLSNVFTPANVPFAAAALLSQLRDCTCKINFQATKIPRFCSDKYLQQQWRSRLWCHRTIRPFAAAKLEANLQLQWRKTVRHCKSASCLFSCKNQVVVAKCMLELQTQTCTLQRENVWLQISTCSNSERSGLYSWVSGKGHRLQHHS